MEPKLECAPHAAAIKAQDSALSRPASLTTSHAPSRVGPISDLPSDLNARSGAFTSPTYASILGAGSSKADAIDLTKDDDTPPVTRIRSASQSSELLEVDGDEWRKAEALANSGWNASRRLSTVKTACCYHPDIYCDRYGVESCRTCGSFNDDESDGSLSPDYFAPSGSHGFDHDGHSVRESVENEVVDPDDAILDQILKGSTQDLNNHNVQSSDFNAVGWPLSGFEYSNDFTDPISQSTGTLTPILFGKFTSLPLELRERVYFYLLVSDKPIIPHLCGKSMTGRGIKFHDDNQEGHNAVYKRLPITRVSKQIREESLSIFYGDNTFAYGADTPIYFERLSHLDRFHMIRKVTLPILFLNEENGVKAMRDIHYNITEQEQYEKRIFSSKSTTKKGAGGKSLRAGLKNNDPFSEIDYNPLETLKKYPLHNSGGLPWMGVFFILRKLSAAFTASDSTNTDYERELVLRVPDRSMFEAYDRLQWFPKVTESLGIKLKFVDGADVLFTEGGFQVEWAQKYQKKDFKKDEQTASVDKKKRTKRALEKFPAMKEVQADNSMQYYRRPCRRGSIEWFKVERPQVNED